MIRTRKRDDDSQYNNSINSDATSLAALDASSICATGSRSSVSISSNKKYQGRRHNNQRPRKRRRKSLTDALQSISLDKHRGVPEQILNMGGKFPFSNNSGNKNSPTVSFTIASHTDDINGANVFGSDTSGVPNTTLNSRQQLERSIDRDGGPSGDGDLYYDDDNSQLTSSTDGSDEVDGEVDGMEDDYDHDEEDDDEDSHSKKLALMTNLEKAERKVMLELVFGNDHQNSRKTAASTTIGDISFNAREVSSCARVPPPTPNSIPGAAASLSPPPPFETISTTTRLATASSVTKATENKEDDGIYKDPADRKIEELLRRSLKNLKEGSHPLQLSIPGSDDNADDSNLFVTTPWKTQDDMAIDPQVYSPRTGEVNPIPSNRNPDSMALDSSGSNITTTKEPNNNNSFPAATAQPHAPPIGHSVRPRSNSLPGGLDMIGTANAAMEMDG